MVAILFRPQCVKIHNSSGTLKVSSLTHDNSRACILATREDHTRSNCRIFQQFHSNKTVILGGFWVFENVWKLLKCKHKEMIHGKTTKPTRTTRTPAFWGYPLPPHDYPFYWVILDPKSEEDKVKVTNLKNLPKFQNFEFWNKHYMRHTFWSCLISYANMKWIRRVLLKIQSGHDSVHRRTDGRTDRRTDGQGETSIPPINFVEAGGIIMTQITHTIWSYGVIRAQWHTC